MGTDLDKFYECYKGNYKKIQEIYGNCANILMKFPLVFGKYTYKDILEL